MKDNPRIHKSPHHFNFDFSGAPQTTDEIIECINNKKYDKLDDLLKSIEWELMGDELIGPINIRHFKFIADNGINEQSNRTYGRS